MADYYKILGLDYTARDAQIKAAYKKLAMQYHPDRNPGDKDAEEMFKLLNEAYHTLSDPLKKNRYDLRFAPNEYDSTKSYQHEVNKRRYSQWQYAQQKRYKIDKEYFKIQGLALLVFMMIAGFCFAVFHTAYYFFEHKNQMQWRTNSQSLKQVNALYGSGRYDSALALIRRLKEEDPLEYRFGFAHDSLTNKLRETANEKYDQHDFSSAVSDYLLLKKHEDPVRFETIRKLAMCEYYLGNFNESLQAMKQLHNQQPDNLELVFSIGILNLEKLNNPEEAMHYFNLGKKLFEQNLTKVYGEAFMLEMNPADVPDIYFYIFTGRARTNIELKNYPEAIIDCRWAIHLRPNLGEPYKLRALANIESKLFEGVCPDLRKANALGIEGANTLIQKYCSK